jgi:lysophospholipase L1-like esterase
LWFNQPVQKLIFPAIAALLFLASCGGPVTSPIPSQNTIHFLALGDSYTIGESVAEKERWPNQLAELIRSSVPDGEMDEGMDVTIIARTGWTTAELWEGIQANPPNGTYDMVSLLIGVNNQYRGYSVDEYREQFRFLLGRAIEYAGGDANRVIVLSIPDWGVTPFAADRDADVIAKEIGMFNSINREETESMGAHYVDVTPISRQALGDHSLVAGDGLHPSGKMYDLWAREALPIAVQILEKK